MFSICSFLCLSRLHKPVGHSCFALVRVVAMGDVRSLEAVRRANVNQASYKFARESCIGRHEWDCDDYVGHEFIFSDYSIQESWATMTTPAPPWMVCAE